MKRYIHIMLSLGLVTGMVSCKDIIEPEVPVVQEQIEEYIPDYRYVETCIDGLGDFSQQPTKGAILTGGSSSAAWNSGESQINSWKVAVYDQDGMLFSQKEGVGAPASNFQMKYPLTGSTKVVAIANLPDFSFPATYAEWQSHVFPFNADNLMQNGVPARIEKDVLEGASFVELHLKRMVAKVNFKMNNQYFRGFQATEVSLHNVAMDSRSGAGLGYVMKDFDYATAAELAAINAGTAASDTYVISFICPENLKGTVSSITRPSDKIPANAPADATYLEVKGHVESSGYGSGDVTYRFYLGKNATNDFNLEGNFIYTVTLNINAGNLGNYQDDYTWKVDVGDFDFAQYDYWWIDPATGWKGKSKVIMQGESALLVVKVPKDLENDESMMYAHLCLGGSEQYEDGRWAPEYVGRNKAELDESSGEYTDGGIQIGGPGDPFNGYLRSEELGDIYTNVNSTGDLSSLGDSYVEISNRIPGYDYGDGPMVLEELGCEGGLITDRNGNNIFGTFAASDGDFANWFVFRVYANTVENLREGYDYGDAACLTLYDDGNYETYSIPIYVNELPCPQVDINKSGQYAYVGQMLQMTGRYFSSAPDWTITSGSSCVGLNTANGTQVSSQNAVNLVCKAEGRATVRCRKGSQERVFEIEVRKPVLHSRFEQLREGYPVVGGDVDNERLRIDERDYFLYLDGGVQPNFAWWYTGVEGQRLTFSDESVFNTYVNARYTGPLGFNFAEEHPAGNYGASNGIYLKGINSLQNNPHRSVQTFDLTYYLSLVDNLGSSGPMNDYYNNSGICTLILNPLYQMKEEVGLTSAYYMTGMTDGGRTKKVEKRHLCNQQALSSPAAFGNCVTVELFDAASSGSASKYAVDAGGNITVNEASNPFGFSCLAGIKIENSRDHSIWRPATASRSLVRTYLIVGICQRLTGNNVALWDHPVLDVSLSPCIYSPSNANNMYQTLSISEYLGHGFSWNEDNIFLTDNSKYLEPFGLHYSYPLFYRDWSRASINNHSDISFNNIIPKVCVDRSCTTPTGQGNENWTWEIPLGMWYDDCVNERSYTVNIPGLTLAETFSAGNPHPMVICDEPLFELIRPSWDASIGMYISGFFAGPSGSIIYKPSDNSSHIYVNLSSSKTYTANVNNNYGTEY